MNDTTETARKVSPVISCIVPIYNVAPYLATCLESIARQTFPDFECICVDDGSKDESGSIAQRFCEKDKRFCLITLTNQGLAAARNRGIEKAVGKYIYFVDSDDFLHSEAFAYCQGLALRERADLVCCDFQAVQESATLDDIVGGLSFSGTVAVADNPLLAAADGRIPFRVSAWIKLYDAELFRELRFDESVRLHEDTFFSLQVLDKARRLVFTAAKVYYYRTRALSLMTSKNHRLSFINLSDAILKTKQLASDRGMSSSQANRLMGEGGATTFCMLALEVVLAGTSVMSAKREEYETCLAMLRKLKRKCVNLYSVVPCFLSTGMLVSYTLRCPAAFRVFVKFGVALKRWIGPHRKTPE